MAAETEIFRLLMSMSGVRSIYSRFLQGRNRATSPTELRDKLSGLFPAAAPAQITEIALNVWQMHEAGGLASTQFKSIQQALGANWPQDVVTGRYWGSTYQVSFNQAPQVPQMTVPGVPEARYVLNAVVKVITQDKQGSRRMRIMQPLLAFSEMPTVEQVLTSIINQIDTVLQPDKYLETVVIDTGTGQPAIDIDFTTVVIIGA